MKKILVFVLALALALPAVAFAKAEFSLGGYVKLEGYWDSSQNNAYMYAAVARNNNVQGTHGHFNMRSQESRFNFTIKGPKVFGAQTTGFIEMDFDGTTDNANVSSSGTWQARVRHAMFRLNWPDTELLLGQYWGLFDNFIPESADDGPMMQYTTALDRIPQIRLTQKFASDWTVAGLIGLPLNSYVTTTTPYSTLANNGSSAETPQLQGMLQYAHDWWGKAAYFGHPKPFTVSVSAGWQRSISRYSNAGVNAFGQNNYAGTAGIINQKFVTPWMVQGGMFIPVIPTHSANLAGTASIMPSFFIGQGCEAFGMLNVGMTGQSQLAHYLGTVGGINYFDPVLMRRFGGAVNAQYYFTNQWFMNVAYGITRNYGVDRTNGVTGDSLLGADQWRTQEEVDATLWYRPVQALKFGLMYSYVYSNYFQKAPGSAGTGPTSPTGNLSNTGNEHRVEFVGIFYF
jgi:hypothetical protein